MTNIILSMCLIGLSFLFIGLYVCINQLTDAVHELNKTIKEKMFKEENNDKNT